MAPLSPIVAKLKVHLKLSISRLRMLQQKDTALAKQQRRAMAQLLEASKFESARIRVENIIRSDLITELHEILELYCELLLARVQLLESVPVDPGLEEAVRSILFAAPRTEVKELQTVRALLLEKYGREFGGRAAEGEGVAERVKRKLRVEPPGDELVDSYLAAIAAAYDVPYGETGDDDEGGAASAVEAESSVKTGSQDADSIAARPKSDGDGGGGGGTLEPPLAASTDELSSATPPRSLAGRSPVSIAPPSPSTENPNASVKLPGPPSLKPSAAKSKKAAGPTTKTNGESAIGGKVPNVDDLEARFAMLKK